MYEKKKQIEELISKGEEGAEDLKNVYSNMDVVHILTDFPYSRAEIDAFDK